MSGLRKPAVMGLVLFLCTLTGHFGKCAPTTVSKVAKDDGILRKIVDFVKHVEESGDQNNNAESDTTSRKESTVAPRNLRSLKSDRGNQIIEIFPRNLRKKEKFIQHLTGPLYFSPKCRKQVYRLYHSTRECTIPAYFKRCARLLTRLAGRSQCLEG